MGCVLAVLGIWLISGDARAPSDGDEGSNLPGILLCLAVVAAGFVLLHFFRELPASTAGVTAIVLGLPALMVFLTFDVDSSELVSLEAVLGGSALVWLIAYLVGPGAGRPVLLGVALAFGWLFAIQAVEDPFQSGLEPPTLLEEGPLPGVDDPAPLEEDDPFADDPFADDAFEDEFGTDVGDDFGSDSSGSGSATTVGIISVLFGAGYLVGARLLDRRGVPGPGVPLSFVGHVALPVGVVFLSEDLEAVGTGIAFIVIGGLAIWSGALGSRRATTVIGAIEIFVGIVLVIGEFMDDSSATSVGVTFFVVGALIVLAAQLLHGQTGETPQLTAGPSQFPGSPGPRRSVTPYAGYPPGQYPAPGPYGPVGGPPPTYPGPQPQLQPSPSAPQPPPPPPPPPAGGSGF